MKFELTLQHRNTPLKVLLADLKKTAQQLGKNKITVAEYNENGQYCAATIIRRLGTWNNALKKTGLKISKPHRIPDALLFDNLKKIWMRLGRQPVCNDLCSPRSLYSKRTYSNRFGTWHNALKAFVEFVKSKNDTQVSAVRAKNSKVRRVGIFHKTKRSVNLRLRFLVMKRDSFKCVACGQAPANDPSVVLQVDHIIPWDKGGESVSENLQTLCSVCNVGKSNTTASLLPKKRILGKRP